MLAMRNWFLTALLGLGCFIGGSISVAGVDDSPLDEFMDEVKKELTESRSEAPIRPTAFPKSSINVSESPVHVNKNDEKQKRVAETVTVGAREFALKRSCEFMQVYRVSTNSGFTDTLSLLKYRASLLGAEYLTVLSHREGVNVVQQFLYPQYYFFNDSGTLNRQPIQTVMVVEMYDCGYSDD